MELFVVLEPKEDGWVGAHCPSLKGCWSQGRTRDEALANIREAIELYLEPSRQDLLQDDRHEVVALAL